MELVLKLPIDYRESLSFRRLEEFLGGDALRANHVYTGIWRELAYLAREGADPGRVRPCDHSLLRNICAAVTTDRVDELFAFLVGDHFKLFVRDGEDFLCLPFANCNSHLSPNTRSEKARGGDVRAFKARCARAEDRVFIQSLLIPADRLVDEAGQPLAGETVERIKRLVIWCDNALFKPTRGAWLYSPDLVANALPVIRRYTDAEIQQVCLYIARQRGHPALTGMTTETLLTKFDGLVGELRGS